MKEFMFIIRGGQGTDLERSPEEMQAHMQKWHDWMGDLARQQILIGGQPLMNEGMTYVESGTKVIDRPLAEGKELIGGYLLIKAENLQGATDKVKDCPGFEYGATVEVREISPM